MEPFLDLFEPSSESQQPLLVGVVIDVSQSMQRNWQNKDGKTLPRIEAIRDSFNTFIKREQQKKRSRGETGPPITIFCLGMGFQVVVHQTDTEFSYEQEFVPRYFDFVRWRKQVDIVCDLLALGEMLPSQKDLDDFKKLLNQKWVHCAKDILEQSVITEDAYTQLIEYVQNALYSSASKKAQRHISSLFKNTSSTIKGIQEEISFMSGKISRDYANTILEITRRDFNKNKENYIDLISGHLFAFAQNYMNAALRALVLGFEIPELVEDLNEKQAVELARYIQADLETEVRKHLSIFLSLHEKKLLLAEKKMRASLNKREVTRRTERFIRKYGWDMLRSLIEETVLSVFSQQFEEQVKKNFPYWIQLSSTREVTRSFNDLRNILPEIINEQVYSNEVMFGSTPFKQALDKAALRLIDRQHADKKKLLLIISDGEFKEGESSMATVNLLKRRNVGIITCIVNERDMLSRLVKYSPGSWPLGARLMLDIASKASDLNNQGMHWKESGNAHVLREEKLCFQINHSSILEEILEIIFE